MYSGSDKSIFISFYILGGISSSLGAIIEGVMAVIIMICVLIIAIPLCICLGVGIGAKCWKSIYTPHSTAVTGLPTTTTTTAVTMDTNMDHSASNMPFPPPYPATEYTQKNPPPYPLELSGEYPPQQHADDPPEGYPIATSNTSPLCT